MELNHTAMKALLDAFDRSDWQEMTVTIGEDRLHVSRQASSNGAAPADAPAPATVDTPAAASAAPPAPEAAAAPAAPPETPAAPAPAPASSAAPSADEVSGTVVESPSVGLFWRAPAPNEPPFVEVGTNVEPGDTLAIVEVMKLMNHVTAPVGGVVTAILADNGATVEYGQPLVAIDPEA